MPRASLLALLPIPTSDAPQPPSFLVVLSIIVGFPVALWTYKVPHMFLDDRSLMMIVFQRRIIYMGSLPIGARQERLQDVPLQYLAGIDCEEIHPPSVDPKAHLSGILVRPKAQTEPPKAVLVYFQGNAGGPLHRLPVFQRLISALYTGPPSSRIPAAIIAVAPRSYWTSTPLQPTQTCILADYISALKYALERLPDARVVLYGHSLGGAIAVCLLSQLRESRSQAEPAMTSPPAERASDTTHIQGLILKNPFASVPGMLAALYPQRWVPYKYLTVFVWDRWDVLEALRAACAPRDGTALGGEKDGGGKALVLSRLAGRMLVLVSELDEVVPPEMGAQIVRTALRGEDAAAPEFMGMGGEEAARGLGTKLIVIKGALHENAWDRRGWAEAVRGYVRDVVKDEGRQ